MANVLKMANVQSILSLFAQGWTQRRIARELGIDRATVRKYVRDHLSGSKPANLLTGSEDPKPASFSEPPGTDSKPANVLTGSVGGADDSKPAIVLTGSQARSKSRVGARSRSEPYGEVILAKVGFKRLLSDLRAEGAKP
jgi:Homeodomain-like domain-containing protein